MEKKTSTRQSQCRGESLARGGRLECGHDSSLYEGRFGPAGR